MALKIEKGDLIAAAKEGKFDIIGHGCNCFHTMGAGIARQIKEQLPEAYAADLKTPYGDARKLGTFSFAKIGSLVVLNCYTQFYYGFRQGIAPVDYLAIRQCMQKISEAPADKKIGLPMIGCGLAGGNWEIVAPIIEEELGDRNITVMYL